MPDSIFKERPTPNSTPILQPILPTLVNPLWPQRTLGMQLLSITWASFNLTTCHHPTHSVFIYLPLPQNTHHPPPPHSPHYTARHRRLCLLLITSLALCPWTVLAAFTIIFFFKGSYQRPEDRGVFFHINITFKTWEPELVLDRFQLH